MELRLKVGARGRGGEKRTREEEEKAGKTKEEVKWHFLSKAKKLNMFLKMKSMLAEPDFF